MRVLLPKGGHCPRGMEDPLREGADRPLGMGGRSGRAMTALSEWKICSGECSWRAATAADYT